MNSWFNQKYRVIPNMVEENTSHEIRLKNVNKTRNYFIEETKQNRLMTKRHKKV